MMSMEQSLGQRLSAGRALRGLFVSLPSPALVEMVGLAGFDFVVLDNEHGPAGLETTEQLVRAATSAGLPTIVRVSGVDQREILRSLDLGVAGVMAPQVNTPEQARTLASASRFPPEGTRGVAFSTRAAGYGFLGGAEYLQRTNEQLLVVGQIETSEALSHLDALLAVSGIDAWFIGPTDLAVSLGYPGQPTHPTVRTVITEALARIQQQGRIAGLMVTTVEDWHLFANLGARLITFPLTTVIATALRAYRA
jgi:4-hydroxy-2-oxoheptanedioate aldolase